MDGGKERSLPKVQVEKSVQAVVEAAKTGQALCERHGVEMLTIDADTSAEVARSHFVTLWSST